MLYILVHIMFNWDDQHTVDMKVLYDSYSLISFALFALLSSSLSFHHETINIKKRFEKELFYFKVSFAI